LHVLVTRPRDDAAPLIEALAARGHTAELAPMLSVRPRDDATVDLDGVQALLFTSANGVRALPARNARRDLPVFAVGQATAEAARAAGFAEVESADGDAAALARLVRDRLSPADGTLFHAAGTVTAGELKETLEAAGFAVRRRALYEAVPSAALPDGIRAGLRDGRFDAVLFFSPRTAETFVTLARHADLEAACRGVSAVCLSPAVAAKAAALPWREVRTAGRPERTALLTALDTIGDGAPSRSVSPREATAKDTMQNDPNDPANADTDGPGEQRPDDSASPTPAQKVIAAFGGIRPMAHKLGVAVSTVQGWKTRNAIPEARHADILAAAREHGIELDAELLRASGDHHGEEAVEAEVVEPAPATGTAEGEGREQAAPGREAEFVEAAEEAGTDEGAARTAATAPPPPPPAAPRATGWVPGMLLGAAVLAIGAGGAVVLRDHWMLLIDKSFERPAAVAPGVSERLQALETRVTELQALRTTVQDLASQVAALEDRVATVAAEAGGGADPARLDTLAEQQDALRQRVSQTGEQVDGIAERLDALDDKLAQASQRVGELGSEVGSLDSQVDSLDSEVDGLAQSAVTAGELRPLREEVTRLGSQMNRLSESAATATDIQALNRDLEQLRDDLQAVRDAQPDTARVEAVARQAAGRQMARALAVQRIEGALDTAAPFQDALAAAREAVGTEGAAAQALDALAPHAADGVPTRAELANSFSQKAAEAVAVSAGGEGQGDLVSGVLRRLGDVVSVRRVGPDATGSDAASVLARAEAALQGGDLAGAVKQVDALQGPPGEVMQPWLERARARLAAEDAVRTLNTQLMQSLAKAGGDGA